MARSIRGAVATLGLAALFGCHEQQWVKPVETSAVFDQAALDFGEVPVGQWREAVIDVRNVGYAPFALLEALELQDNPYYHIEASTELVPPGQTRKVRVLFHPMVEGLAETQVKVATDANNRPEEPVPVRGVGAPAQLGIEPAELQFETLEIDSDRTLEVTIQNPADIAMTISVQGDQASHFGSDVVDIPPMSTVKVNARFHPQALGALGARLQVLPCATCTPIPVPMAGTSVEHAFAFDPAPIPFPETPVHEISQSFTRMRNITWRPVKLTELVPSDIAFTTLNDLRERTLGPGEQVQVDMQFAARFPGQNAGELEVRYESDRARRARVEIDARGGHPQLAVTPITIDFGRLPVGGKLQRIVRLTNAGVTGDLLFQGAAGVSGAIDQFNVGPPRRGTQQYDWVAGTAWPNLNAPDLAIAPAGDALDVPVFFEPTATGDFEARIRFWSDAPYNGVREVMVKGTAFQPGPCAWRVLPNPVDFGNVPPGTGAILGFRFENAGTEVCAVKDIRISNDAGGVFWMPGGALTGGVVLQDDAFSAMIAFRSSSPGQFTGELQMTVSDPVNPTIRVPIRAVAQTSCLVANPSPVNFGPIRYDCAPEPRITLVSNACSTPVTVNDSRIGPGTSSQYHIVRAPAYPLTLQPGQGYELELTYDRTVLGQHYSPIFVDVAGEPEPFLIPMWAETNHEGTAVDRFVQGNSKEIDVLFVVSNTTTMQTYQQRLAAAVPAWVAAAESQGISLHVGVTTTGLVERASAACGGGANGGEAGRLFPVDNSRPRYFAATGANVATLQQNLMVGACHNLVQGLETMRMALSTPLVNRADDPRTAAPNDGNLGFLRPSARLAVVFLSDEEDNSGFAVSSYVQFLDEIKGPNMSHRAEAYAIVPKGCSVPTASPSAQRFEDLANATGGDTANICASQGAYGWLLSEILQRASGPQASFRLSFPIRSATEITVLVNGVRSSAWTLNTARNSVVFTSGSVPAAGDSIEVRYVSECGTVTR